MEYEYHDGKLCSEHNGRRIFWGIIIVAAAVAFILAQFDITMPWVGGVFGVLNKMGIGRLLLFIVCVVSFIDGIISLKLGQILFSLGFGYWALEPQSAMLPHINIWAMLLVCAALYFGLKMIFPGDTMLTVKKNGKVYKGKKAMDELNKEIVIDGDAVTEDADGNGQNASENGPRHKQEIVGDCVFSNKTKYIESKNVSAITGDTVFASVKYYFDDTLQPNEEIVYTGEVVFASAHFYVPHTWNVVFEGDSVASVRSDSNYNSVYKENAPTLRVVGDRVFSKTYVHYT